MNTTLVGQYDLKTNSLIGVHPTCNVEGFDASHIAKCIRGERTNHKGYAWHKVEFDVRDLITENGNLLHGDCANKLQLTKNNSIDLIAVDPPYGIDVMGSEWDRSEIEKLKKKSGVVGGGPVGMKFNPEDSIKLQKYLEPIFSEYLRVLKPGAFCLVFSQARSAHRVGIALENEGFELRDQLVWDYGCGQQKAQGIQNFIKKNRKLTDDQKEQILKETEGFKTPQLAPTYETIWLAQKPKEGNTVENFIEWGTGLVDFRKGTIKNRFSHSKPSPSERIEGGKHPTQKPISLMRELISTFSKEGDVVLDSFVGSGTTAIACLEEKRKYLAIEKDLATFLSAKNRISSRQLSI